jgi:toluene monooxygenase system protein E
MPAAQLDALGREHWQQNPAFQPLRRIIERLLVSYDWGEALIALNGIIKPIFDQLWFEQLAGVAERHHDEILEKILISLGDDGRWHEAWFVNFAKLALASDPGNREVLERCIGELRPLVMQAVQAMLPAFDGLFGDEGERAYRSRELEASLEAHLAKLDASAEANREARHAARP